MSSFRHYLAWVNFSHHSRTNLDIPFNRFLSYIGWHLIYVSLLLMTVFETYWAIQYGEKTQEEKEAFLEERSKASIPPLRMKWNHYGLWFFSLSNMYRDLLIHRAIRLNASNFNQAWRAAEFVSNLCTYRAMRYKYQLVSHYACFYDPYFYNGIICSSKDIAMVKWLDEWYSVYLAIAVAICCGRVLYWLQLHHYLGPIVINLTRGIVDTSHMMTFYLLIGASFAVGLVYLLCFDVYASKEEVAAMNNVTYAMMANSTDHRAGVSIQVSVIISTLFWTLLDPGPVSEQGMMPETFRNFMAMGFYGLYQIIAVIIFLNLMIALMNVSVQKVEYNRNVNWRFIRTSIRMEFFDRANVIPPPFCIISVVWFYFFGMYRLFRWLIRKCVVKCRPNRQRKRKLCKPTMKKLERRITHVRLLSDLIDGYVRTSRLEKEREKGIQKKDLLKWKKEIVDEIMQRR